MLKYRVTMINVVGVTVSDSGEIATAKHEAVDYVPEEMLEDYVADAKTRWQSVNVSDTPESNK